MNYDLNKMMHQCSVCLKQFRFVSKLRRHQLTHSGLKPFICSICSKAFRQSAHLKGHLESHMKRVRGSADSQLSCIQSEGSYVPFVETPTNHFERTGISEGLQVVDQSMWCSALQTHSESVWKHVEEEQRLENSVRDTTHTLTVTEQKHSAAEKRSCDIEQWNYGGSGGLTETENDYQRTPPDPCPEKQERVNFYSEQDPQTNVTVSNRVNMLNIPRKNQCATCLKCFSAPSKLRRHVLIHTSQRPFGCHLCTKAFRQLAHLKIHLTTHFSQRQSKAKQEQWQSVASGSVPQGEPLITSVQYCAKPSGGQWAAEKLTSVPEKSKSKQGISKNKDQLKFDGKNLSGSQIMHECPVCFKLFSAPSKLRRHCLIHTGQRPFQCSTCYQSFRQLAHLKAHYSVHTGPCKRRTSSLQALKFVSQHQPPSSKTKLKRFVSSSLSRKFRSGKPLSIFRTSPTPVLDSQSPTQGPTGGETISGGDSHGSREGYWCTVCSKHFSAPSKLKRHLLIHTGQRPFKCLVCSRAFRQRSHLKGHRCKGEGRRTFDSQLMEEQDNHALGINVTEDVVDGEQPFMGSTMEDHMERCTPSGTVLSQTNCSPGDKDELPCRGDVDVPVVSKQTNDCGHQCTICLKMFDFPSKLSRHLLIHMDIKPFTCTVCNKSFRQLCHLQSHEKVHTATRNTMDEGGNKCNIVASASETSAFLNKNRDQGLVDLPSLRKAEPECASLGSDSDQDVRLSRLKKSNPTADTENINFPSSHIQDKAMAGKVSDEDASAQKKRNVYQCTYCLKTFDFPSKLSRHLRIHTGIRPYECHVCHKSFKQLCHLQCHQWIHRKTLVVDRLLKQQNPISSDCATLSKEKERLPSHQQETHGSFTTVHQGHDAYMDQEPLPNWSPVGFDQLDQYGPSTDSETKSEIDLQMNGAVNLALKPETGVIGDDGVSRNLDWDCEDQPDPNKRSLEERRESKHQRDVHCCVPEDRSNRSPTVSDCCRLGFSHEQPDFGAPKEEAAEEVCEKHLTEPPNDLPICVSCSQCFPTLKKLQTHKCPMQVPEERSRKSYHCAVCFKSFEAPSKLKRHYVIHTGQRPYQCTMCNKAFTQSSHLKTHIMSHR